MTIPGTGCFGIAVFEPSLRAFVPQVLITHCSETRLVLPQSSRLSHRGSPTELPTVLQTRMQKVTRQKSFFFALSHPSAHPKPYGILVLRVALRSAVKFLLWIRDVIAKCEWYSTDHDARSATVALAVGRVRGCLTSQSNTFLASLQHRSWTDLPMHCASFRWSFELELDRADTWLSCCGNRDLRLHRGRRPLRYKNASYFGSKFFDPDKLGYDP